jgi:hypothetical protein
MLDVCELAILPIAHLVSQSDPFDRYCGQTGGLAGAYREVVNNGVWGYQLYTYLVLIGVYFGEETRQQVRNYQLTLSSPDTTHREALETMLDVIEVAAGMRTAHVSTASGDIQVPVEMHVALALLLGMPCSPDYARDASMRDARIASMGIDTDWHLADCLSTAREEMVVTYSTTFAHCNTGERGFTRGRPITSH